MKTTIIAIAAAAVLASSSAWAGSRDGTAEQACEDIAAHGTVFEECVEAAATGRPSANSERCVAIRNAMADIMSLSEDACGRE
jgi:hypothetical protein